MHLIIIHKNKKKASGSDNNLLRFAMSSQPIAGAILEGLSRLCAQNMVTGSSWSRNGRIVFAIPEEWNITPQADRPNMPEVISYNGKVPIYSDFLQKTKRNGWSVFSNGRFATQINIDLLHKVLKATPADVFEINAEPQLLAYHEELRLTAQNNVAGFRRCYSDAAKPAPIPIDWPHYTIIKTDIVERLLADQALSKSFSAFLEACRLNKLTVRAFNIAGVALDLETEEGLLDFCKTMLSGIRPPLLASTRKQRGLGQSRNPNMISHDSRLIGKVLLGKNVHIGPKAVVIGPTIVGNDAIIESGAIISSSIIGPGISIQRNQIVHNRIIQRSQRIDNGQIPACAVVRFGGSPRKRGCRAVLPAQGSDLADPRERGDVSSLCHHKFDLPRYGFSLRRDENHHHNGDFFCNQSRFSYARCFKRIADLFAAIVVLILFAPVTPFIALAIKLSSPGPVFFKDKRQGLHGKEFHCLKFRSMTVGSDKLQDKLRAVSQVDGPQFKMSNDPRLSAVGKFLRDTNIDEIPQFINVLLGQMSVVGPRPSPESENTLCPFWRDVRLSVRPGITGLWQVCRTRQPTQDFQEWIRYDTKYVKELSLWLDLWICWKTTKELFRNFIRQF